MKISNTNIAFIYDYTRLNPYYIIWNIADDSTRLYVKVNSTDSVLTTMHKSSSESLGDKLKPILQIRYFLYSDIESKILIDSSTHYFDWLKDEPQSIYSFQFRTELSKKYLMKIILTQLKSNISVTSFLNIDRTANTGCQNFLLINSSTHLPVFEKYPQAGDSFLILHYKKEIDSLYVGFYFHQFDPAPPVFSEAKNKYFNSKPDRTWKISIHEKQSFSSKGIYFLKVNKSDKSGYSIFRFNDDFPTLTTPEELIKPLRYISKNEEYLLMSDAADKKAELDSFWLVRGGDRDRAKVLIREYYNRIQFANEHFSSYKEGWQTDRGLIYVIYGKPDIVYKNISSENWNYNKTAAEPTINFIFVKTGNIFSDNDYELMRDGNYENSWNIAVHKWRHGRINEITKQN